jgi:hypothetical protein
MPVSFVRTSMLELRGGAIENVITCSLESAIAILLLIHAVDKDVGGKIVLGDAESTKPL